MQRRCRAALLGCALTALTACAGGSPAPAPAGPPGPGRFEADFATSSAFFTLMDGMKKGLPVSPHGFVRIYYSSNLRGIVESSSFTAPEGSVAIKLQDRDEDGNVDGIRVMIKKSPGYDDANGDWYYEARAADGTLTNDPPPGPASFCVGCHVGFPSTDRLAGTTLR